MSAKAKSVEPNPKRLVIAGVLALAAAYIFASLAIDRGNFFYYLLAFAGIGLGARYFWQAVRSAKR